jgi:RNA polymerase sigma-70 factor (ECF subfamily)
VSATPAPETYEAFVRLFMAHEARLRGFLRTLLPSWEDVDDVLQETSLVAWRKFDQFQPGSHFMAWIGTIARFEALRHIRKKARDRLVFNEDLVDLLADEALQETGQREIEHQALRRCLDKLPAPQARWLELAYQPGIKFHEAAQLAGKSADAFYKTLQRLRTTLHSCMSQELQKLAP